MGQKLKEELANALSIEPEDIMDYRQTSDGKYNVVLFSYQKYTQVEPEAKEVVPKNLRAAYQRPYSGNKMQLGLIAKHLGITVTGEDGGKPTKKGYEKAINHYRLNH